MIGASGECNGEVRSSDYHVMSSCCCHGIMAESSFCRYAENANCNPFCQKKQTFFLTQQLVLSNSEEGDSLDD